MISGDHRVRRGGLGRPVRMSGIGQRLAALASVLAWILVVAGPAAAHGGVPTLQLQEDRINPGGSAELRGDMTGDEPVDVSLQAGDGSTLALGRIETDWEGHFVTAVTIPADIAAGTYIVRVTSPLEEATTRLVIGGPPLLPEADGQPLGRDEALAGPVAAASAPAGQSAVQWTPPPGADFDPWRDWRSCRRRAGPAVRLCDRDGLATSNAPIRCALADRRATT